MDFIRNNLPPYSVLMSVYIKENPAYLSESLESMLTQTVPPSDFVLVCDGKLTDELNVIVKSFESEYSGIFNSVRLIENVGTGLAANAGIKACKYDLIAKMDSDDVCLPERCQKQLLMFLKNPKLDMVGAYIEEFDNDTGKSIAVKKTPVTHKEILKYAKRRNPFNNQTLIFKKSMAEKVGGYTNRKRCEDYEFVTKMLMAGAVGENLPEVLVKYRVSKDNLKRRKNWANTKSFIKVRKNLFKSGFSNIFDFLIPCIAQLLLFILPERFTAWIYKHLLRG